MIGQFALPALYLSNDPVVFYGVYIVICLSLENQIGNGLLLLLSCCFHKYSLPKEQALRCNRRCIQIRDLLSAFQYTTRPLYQ